MYPEGGGGEEYVPAPAPAQGRFSYHMEGLIPLILIIIIGLALAYSQGWINSSTPIIGSLLGFAGTNEPVDMLVVGQVSYETQGVLNASQTLVKVRTMDAKQLERNPASVLAQYKIVMLDQSNQADKEVSMQFGYAIQNYVKTGGKFIIVKDSGIRQPNALDVIGWKATFGDIIPVSCEYVVAGQPSCTQPQFARGKLWVLDPKHPLTKGFEQFPAEPTAGLFPFETFDVTPQGRELAYIEDEFSKKNYTGIVESNQFKAGLGKVIYFNYDPGVTDGLFQSTLKYLSGKS